MSRVVKVQAASRPASAANRYLGEFGHIPDGTTFIETSITAPTVSVAQNWVAAPPVRARVSLPAADSGRSDQPGAVDQDGEHLHVHADQDGRPSEAPEHSGAEGISAAAGETETIRVTGAHPFWSLDRQAWVRVEDLQAGERLQGIAGPVRVVSRTLRAEAEPVYNIEVDGDHCYRVGRQGLLVHNASAGFEEITGLADYNQLPEEMKDVIRTVWGRRSNDFGTERGRRVARGNYAGARVEGRSDIPVNRSGEVDLPGSTDDSEQTLISNIKAGASSPCTQITHLFTERRACGLCSSLIRMTAGGQSVGISVVSFNVSSGRAARFDVATAWSRIEHNL